MKFKVPSALAKPMLKLQYHSPKIMLGAGIVGVVGAGVLACKSTLALTDLLEQAEKTKHERITAQNMGALVEKDGEQVPYSEEDLNKDLLKLKVNTVLGMAKLYAPAIALAAVSISLIAAAHVVQSRRAAAMTAAYAGLKEGYDRLRKNIVDKYGEEEEAKLRHGVAVHEEVVESKDGKTKVKKTEHAAGYSAYAKLFTEGNINWTPNADNNWFFLTSQQRYWNDKLQRDGYVFLNDVYYALGIEKTKAGQLVGWTAGEKNGDGYIDFGISDSLKSFFTDAEGSIWLDFNVDGEVLHLMR